MERWNIRHLSVYAIAILVIIILSFTLPALTDDNFIINAYQKLLFALPILFIIAAFLAFKISETGVALIALSFLIFSLEQPLLQFLSAVEIPVLSSEGWPGLFRMLPVALPFTLSLIFLIPDKTGRYTMSIVKIILALLPLLLIFSTDRLEYIFIGEFQYGDYRLPWLSVAASFFPLAGPFLHQDRRSGTFSAALTSVLLLSLLPTVLSLGDFLRDTSCLFVGIILLHSLYRVYWENSYIDELTGLYNRRALDERFRRLGKSYVLSMADVDHFKNFNDTYGHDEGDNVLRLVAKILRTHFGKSAYRYGGEEFCVVFRKKDVKSAAEEMNQARAAIADHGFSIRKKVKNRKKSARQKTGVSVKKVKLTISAGIAAPLLSTRDAAAVLKNADKALYLAKKNGRNRVEISRLRK